MDIGRGVYVATKHDFDHLQVPQQNHHKIQKQYIFSDDDVNTSKDIYRDTLPQLPFSFSATGATLWNLLKYDLLLLSISYSVLFRLLLSDYPYSIQVT